MGTRETATASYRSLLVRFVDFGATSPETAVSLAAIGRELSDRIAAYLERQELLLQGQQGRWWVTERGLHAIAVYAAGGRLGHAPAAIRNRRARTQQAARRAAA